MRHAKTDERQKTAILRWEMGRFSVFCRGDEWLDKARNHSSSSEIVIARLVYHPR
jgi:hypothetical protein